MKGGRLSGETDGLPPRGKNLPNPSKKPVDRSRKPRRLLNHTDVRRISERHQLSTANAFGNRLRHRRWCADVMRPCNHERRARDARQGVEPVDGRDRLAAWQRSRPTSKR